MDIQAIGKWLRTAGLAAAGGGVAAAITAAMDPSKYHFPHDFGSGKLLTYFFEGFGVTFAALLLKSPLGQSVMSSIKSSQQQVKDDQALLASTKADFKTTGAGPPPAGPPKPDAKP